LKSMFKVEKNTIQELVVNLKEFFVGATIEEATKTAHEQKTPKDDATITITDRRFLGSNIKVVSEKKDGDTRPQTNQGSKSEAGKVGTKNE